MGVLWRIIQTLSRKKVFTENNITKTDLKRCLSVYDLLTLSIGCTLGAGLYVVAGQVAREKAGPSVTISFLVAAVASALAATCYAEFAARVPRAGSAYVYSYITVGEFIAFVIGWNLVLEYVIGSASVSRGMSGYIDSLLGNRISNYFKSTIPMSLMGLSDYPDFFACGICVLAAVLLGSGIQESSITTQVLTVVNLLVLVYLTICGAFKFDFHNWNLSKDEVPPTAGSGGFMPFGFSGMMSGAASCFYAFIGFDVLASAGEEAKNPRRDMPIAILASIFIIFMSYFAMSVVITLMCPYYLLDPTSAPAEVFRRVGWNEVRYVISVGAIAGLTTSLVSGMLPLPRVFYVMGSDGLLFRCLGKVSPKTQTPVNGSILAGIISACASLLFDLEALVNMMSIGTLLAYTLVSTCVLILRYENIEVINGNEDGMELSNRHNDEGKSLIPDKGFQLRQLWSPQSVKPNQTTFVVAKCAISCLCLSLILFCGFLILFEDQLNAGEAIYVVIACFLGICVLNFIVILHRQPKNVPNISFKVPLVPLFPALSLFVNIYLMLKLPYLTWVRFGVWMVIGLFIYFFYGVRHATLASTDNLNGDRNSTGQNTEIPSENENPSSPTIIEHSGVKNRSGDHTTENTK